MTKRHFFFQNCFIDIINSKINEIIYNEASCGAKTQACDCKRDSLWVPILLAEMKYFIFSFIRSGVQAKGGVEFRHSTRNVEALRVE